MLTAKLTSMEAALLRSLGMTAPVIEPVRGARLEYRAVIVRQNGRTIEALGHSADDATAKVIRLAVSK
jgi:hypothetical protein